MIDEIITICKSFQSNNVKYFTTGGFVESSYGYIRNTVDVDVLVEDSTATHKKTRNAFIEIGSGVFETKKFVSDWIYFTPNFDLWLDVMTLIKRCKDVAFKNLLHPAAVVQMEVIAANFIDYQSLIISKKVANGLRDQMNIEELDKLNGT
jgi:hypothetical protein